MAFSCCSFDRQGRGGSGVTVIVLPLCRLMAWPIRRAVITSFSLTTRVMPDVEDGFRRYVEVDLLHHLDHLWRDFVLRRRGQFARRRRDK
jgi:hypothetical protein